MSSFESIRKLTAEISGVDQETITLETNLRETLDSLELAELDIAIDEEFQVPRHPPYGSNARLA